MKTRVHRVELLIIDFDNLGASEITTVIECQKYPNRCISPEVKGITTKEIEWTDDHPLNNRNTSDVAYKQLFEEPL